MWSSHKTLWHITKEQPVCTRRAHISGVTLLAPGKEKSQAGEPQIKLPLDFSPLKWEGWIGGQPSWLLGCSLPCHRGMLGTAGSSAAAFL